MHVDKQPAEKITVGFDFTADLGAASISTVDSITSTPSGLTIGTPAEADGIVSVLIEGGTDGTAYSLEATVTADDGQVLQLPGTVQVAEQPADADAAFNTPAGLKAAFPAFAAVANSVISMWLTRAARVVDDSWAEDDRAYAQALLAAHYMVEQGLGTGAEAEMAANGASGFKTMRSGSLTLERFDAPSDAAGGGFSGTSYGRQFLPLLRANRGGPLITGAGTLPSRCYGWPF